MNLVGCVEHATSTVDPCGHYDGERWHTNACDNRDSGVPALAVRCLEIPRGSGELGTPYEEIIIRHFFEHGRTHQS
jgi:hypothetical protein